MENFARTYSWSKSFKVAAFGLAVCVTTAEAPDARGKPGPLIDPRIGRLERFFDLYRCPAPYYVKEYLSAADRYGVDYRLLPAVSVRETLCGVEGWRNNRWGYHPGVQAFSSVEAGIDFVTRQLAENPFYKGKTLPDKLFTYNPRQTYPDEVQWIMRQIEPQ
jgi:hypothetical protein